MSDRCSTISCTARAVTTAERGELKYTDQLPVCATCAADLERWARSKGHDTYQEMRDKERARRSVTPTTRQPAGVAP